jgi:hypothetical protein
LLVGSIFSIGIMQFTKSKKLGISLVLIGFIGLAFILYIFNQDGVLGNTITSNTGF